MICKYYDCTGLTSIQIPNSATYIGEDALYGCTGLTSIQVPSPITKIGNSVFEGCENIVSINVDNDNPEYSSEDNVMFNKDKTELIYCARGKEGVYEIPNSVTKIGLRAFSRCTIELSTVKRLESSKRHQRCGKLHIIRGYGIMPS